MVSSHARHIHMLHGFGGTDTSSKRRSRIFYPHFTHFFFFVLTIVSLLNNYSWPPSGFSNHIEESNGNIGR